MTFSPELRVMRAPRRAYVEALAAPESGRWLAVRRPLLVALVLGAGSAFASTGHLTLGLLATGVACWSFVALIQAATGAAVIWPAGRTAVPFARRLDLWFMGHGPWSLWILTATTVMGTAGITWPVEWPVILTALVPIVWTSVIAAAFCRVVLGDAPGAAIVRTAVHQALTWTIALVYVGWAVALGPRVAAFLGK